MMEYLNSSHPAYDPELEILSRMPCIPEAIAFDSLAKVFGQVNHLLVGRWVKGLQGRFPGKIHTGNRGGSRVVWMSRFARLELDRVAEKYYDKLYPVILPEMAGSRRKTNDV